MKPHHPTRPVGEYDDDDEDLSEEEPEEMDFLPPYPVAFPNIMFPNPR